MQAFDDQQLQAKTAELRQHENAAESIDALLPEAFATMREAARRVLGIRHYDTR